MKISIHDYKIICEMQRKFVADAIDRYGRTEMKQHILRILDDMEGSVLAEEQDTGDKMKIYKIIAEYKPEHGDYLALDHDGEYYISKEKAEAALEDEMKAVLMLVTEDGIKKDYDLRIEEIEVKE